MLYDSVLFPLFPPRTVEELQSSARTVQAQAQAAAEEALVAERHVEELAMTQQVGDEKDLVSENGGMKSLV